MLDAGQDNALLRFTLGSQLLNEGDASGAAEHLRAAVLHDPGYSAAWKLLGRALHAAGDPGAACAAFNSGMEVAERKGDVQAAKEMRVFLKRAQKALSGNT